MIQLTLQQRYPNNKPELTNEQAQARRGMVLECLGPALPGGHRSAWFVNIFNVHEMHIIKDPNIK